MDPAARLLAACAAKLGRRELVLAGNPRYKATPGGGYFANPAVDRFLDSRGLVEMVALDDPRPHLRGALQRRICVVSRSLGLVLPRDFLRLMRLQSIEPGGLLVMGLLMLALKVSGCRALQINSLADRIHASNHRDWSPEFSRTASAEIHGTTVHLRNIRNNFYLTEKDFVPDWYHRTFDLSQVRSVDFILVPFSNLSWVAHTMMSFELDDGSYLGVSVEIRTERGEAYSPMLGISRQFELVYVIADERDLIRLRTRHRDVDVYIYPTNATPEEAQQLLVDVLHRVNYLNEHPEFYNTFSNNCTTNLLYHVNRSREDRIRYAWQILLPGFSDRYAYDIGLIDNRIPFETLKALAHVNDLAEANYDDPNFSQVIRQRRDAIERLASRIETDAPQSRRSQRFPSTRFRR